MGETVKIIIHIVTVTEWILEIYLALSMYSYVYFCPFTRKFPAK